MPSVKMGFTGSDPLTAEKQIHCIHSLTGEGSKKQKYFVHSVCPLKEKQWMFVMAK
jgi:hypothetical protein